MQWEVGPASGVVWVVVCPILPSPRNIRLPTGLGAVVEYLSSLLGFNGAYTTMSKKCQCARRWSLLPSIVRLYATNVFKRDGWDILPRALPRLRVAAFMASHSRIILSLLCPLESATKAVSPVPRRRVTIAGWKRWK